MGIGSLFSFKNELPANVQAARKNAENLRRLFEGVSVMAGKRRIYVDAYITAYVYGWILEKAADKKTAIMSTYVKVGEEIPQGFSLKRKYRKEYEKTGSPRDYLYGAIMSRDNHPTDSDANLMLSTLRFDGDKVYLVKMAAELVQKRAEKGGISLEICEKVADGKAPAAEPPMSKGPEKPQASRQEVKSGAPTVSQMIKPALALIRNRLGSDLNGMTDEKIIVTLIANKSLIDPAKKPEDAFHELLLRLEKAKSEDERHAEAILRAFLEISPGLRQTYYDLICKD